MAHHKILLTFVALFLMVSCNHNSQENKLNDPNTEYIVRASKVRDMLSTEYPELNSISDEEELVLRLREIAHFSINTDKHGINYFYHPDINIDESVIRKKNGYICQGIGITYQQILASFNIPSRYVALFSSPYLSANSHATTEVFVNGRWIISDATFNFSILNGMGEEISAATLYNIVKAGEPLSFKIGPSGFRPERDIYSYPSTIQDLAQNVAIFPGPNDSSTIYLPESWDGSYILSGGPNYGTILYNENDIYGLINLSFTSQ